MVARARRSEWEKFFPSVFPNIGYFESNEYSSVTRNHHLHSSRVRMVFFCLSYSRITQSIATLNSNSNRENGLRLMSRDDVLGWQLSNCGFQLKLMTT